MSPGSDDHLRDLQRRLVDAERRLDRVPARWAQAAAPQVYYLACGRGNFLAALGGSNYYGLKRPGASATAVPTLSPSTVSGALPDGLSAGQIYQDDGTSSAVWIGVRLLPGVWSGASIIAGSVAFDDWTGTLTQDTPFLSRRVASVPVTGSPGAYAKVYNPWSL